MRYIFTLFILVQTITGFSQEATRSLTKRIIVKTNVLSLIAQRPTVTVEKVFSKTVSAEVSFVQGRFNNFLFTDHYDYHGFLVRGKKHFTALDFGAVSPYAAIYAGNLKRNIQTTGQTDNTGWIGYPSRDFSANSVRAGGSFGVSYIAKNKIIIDGLASLGYGRYLNINKTDPSTYSNGYLDTQIWLSVGYCF